jgi:hypothetical protein
MVSFKVSVYLVRFEVLTAVRMMMFWVMTPCGLAGRDTRGPTPLLGDSRLVRTIFSNFSTVIVSFFLAFL